jgi:hypothetical protein
MSVHSATLHVLDIDMYIEEPTSAALPFQAGDAEWVADLLDTFRDGDLDALVEQLGALLASLRQAAKARQILAGVNPGLLREGMRLRATRREGQS